MISTADIIANIGTSSYCAHQAAKEFVATYWAQPRKLENFHADGLCATFCVANGLRTYRAEWNDDMGCFSITLAK